MKIWKRSMFVLGTILLLLIFSYSVSAVSDDTNDVWKHTYSSTGYSWNKFGSKPSIDITDVSYSIDGNQATLTMKTVGNIVTNSENTVYTMHLSYSDSAFYMVYYSNGNGVVLGQGSFSGSMSQLDYTVSGNTFTGTFEVEDPNLGYNVIGFNAEHTDVDAETGDAWWDYAPNSEAPYYSAGGDNNGNDNNNQDNNDNTNQPSGGTPGFEILTLIAAITISIIILRKRK